MKCRKLAYSQLVNKEIQFQIEIEAKKARKKLTERHEKLISI